MVELEDWQPPKNSETKQPVAAKNLMVHEIDNEKKHYYYLFLKLIILVRNNMQLYSLVNSKKDICLDGQVQFSERVMLGPKYLL